MERKMKIINNVLFYGAFLFGIIVLGMTYYQRSKLPQGICPINNNQNLFYGAIILLILSFVFNMFLSIKYKKKA